MATLNVENIPDELYVRLQQLATAQNRSISDQVVSLLERALPTETSQGETTKSVTEILAEIRSRRDRRPIAMGNLDSIALIREDRDSR